MARRQTDHRDFVVQRKDGTAVVPKKPARRNRFNVDGRKRWWTFDPDDAAKAVSDCLSFYARTQRWRLQLLNRMARWYDNQASLGISGAGVGGAVDGYERFGEQVTINVSASVVDTLVSKIVRNKPKPYFLTNDGDHIAQRKAKDRNVWLAGLFYQQNTYAKSRMSVQDACVFGPGILRIRPGDGTVVHERVLPHQLFVDPIEALATSGPRTLHCMTFMDRDEAKERYPGHDEAIDSDTWLEAGAYAWDKSLADLVCIRESWRLPSKKGAGDGVYLISVNDAPLDDPQPWTRDSFPFAILSYSRRPRGWWPIGLIERGQSIQYEIDRVAWAFQNNVEIIGGPKLFLPAGSGISPDQITNDFSPMIEGTQKPEYISPPVIQEDLRQYYNDKKAEYYELAGISQSDASSTKPRGEMSGEAIRLVHDIGTERFISFGQAYEEFIEEVARQSIQTAQEMMDAAKKAAKEGDPLPKLEMTLHRRATARTVDFNDLGFEEGEELAIQCFPVSMLPSDPEGRTQRVQDDVQAGWIDPDTARDLIDYPDTGAVEGLHNAGREFAKAVLDALVNGERVNGEDTYAREKGYDDPALWNELAREYYQRYKRPGSGVPDARLQKIRDIIQQASALVAAQQAAMMPPVAPGGPQAVPAPPPVSNLLPNAPGAQPAKAA